GPRAKLEAVVAGILEYFDLNPYLFDLLGHAESRHHAGSLENWHQLRTTNVRRLGQILEGGRRERLWDRPRPETPGPMRPGGLGPEPPVLMLLGGLRAVLRFSPPPRPANLARRLVEDFLHGASRRCPAEAARG